MGCCVVTFTVGGLSAINAIAGAPCCTAWLSTCGGQSTVQLAAGRHCSTSQHTMAGALLRHLSRHLACIRRPGHACQPAVQMLAIANLLLFLFMPACLTPLRSVRRKSAGRLHLWRAGEYRAALASESCCLRPARCCGLHAGWPSCPAAVVTLGCQPHLSLPGQPDPSLPVSISPRTPTTLPATA